jgi:hypothetical protein
MGWWDRLTAWWRGTTEAVDTPEPTLRMDAPVVPMAQYKAHIKRSRGNAKHAAHTATHAAVHGGS